MMGIKYTNKTAIKVNAAFLSNYEVMQILQELKDNTQKKHKREGSLATVTYETVHYLQNSECKNQSQQAIHKFLEAMKNYKLTKIEKLMMVNTPPRTELEIQLIVQESEERLSEEQVTTHPHHRAMPLVLHMKSASPPCCAVLMLGDILGLEFEFKEPSLLHLENKTPEFKKMNPMATIPVLQDDDFTVSESHAIMQYLLAKYGGDKREELYPSDPRARALIDQCMFFDTGVFFVRLKVVALPTLLDGLTGPTAKHIEDIELAYGVVEAYLEGKKYIAADHLTLADLSVGSTAAAMQGLHKLDPNKFPRCKAWLDLLEQETFFKKINTPGATELANIIHLFWEKNKNNQ